MKKLLLFLLLSAVACHAQVLSSVQTAFWGDASCDPATASGACTVSTTVGVTKLTQAYVVGHIVTLFIMYEGTAVWPTVNTIVNLGNSSGITWTHISGGTVIQCGTAPSTNCAAVTSGATCQGNILNSASHHFSGDCYYGIVTGSGVTGVTVTAADTTSFADITNSSGFFHEWSCTLACPTPIVDAQGSKIYPGNGASAGCTSCTGPALTLVGANDIVEQMSIFEENCDSGTCTSSPYTLESWDNSAQNAAAYLFGTGLSGGAATWPQNGKGGGIFSAFALSIQYQANFPGVIR